MDTITLVDLVAVAGDLTTTGVLMVGLWAFVTGKLMSTKSEESQNQRVADVAALAVAGNNDKTLEGLADAVQKGVAAAIVGISERDESYRKEISGRLTGIEIELARLRERKEIEAERL